jgi:signal transduction histidine kinase
VSLRPSVSEQNSSSPGQLPQTDVRRVEDLRFVAGGALNPIYRRFIPRTTSGVLAAIMMSVLLPLLVIQSGIYIFWYKTRSQTEIDTNLEFARVVALSFLSYLNDVQRTELAIGQLMEVGRPLPLERFTALLAVSRKEYPAVIRFSIADPQGVILASSDPEAVGTSVASRIDLGKISAGPEWMIGNLREASGEEKSTFTIVRRIGISGDPRFFVIGVLDPDRLGELTFSITHPVKGVFTLFDRNGTLVYSGAGSQIGHRNWKKSDPILAESIARGKEQAGIIDFPLDHTERIVARVPVPGSGWTAGASLPASAAFAPIYRTLVWVVLLNGAVLVVSFLGAIGLSRYLIRRLDFLRAYARRIAEGNYSSQSHDAKLRELAELENSFTVMAEQVQARQRALESAIRDLTRSNQELEQFAYVASHDLQEPLRVITGFVQLIAQRYKGHLDKDADRYIGFITDAVARQQQLIMGILAFSRVGRKGTAPAPCDANRALEAAVDNIRQAIRESNATVIYDQLPIVQADEYELVQLFQNLVSNGIKFRGNRDPEVHISAQPEDGKWIFAVRDNGIGVEPQYWDRIFVMFRRLHTRKKYPGTGIGLSICKKIVERHGGRIWLESKPGEGSVFYFTLPAAEKHNESERE